MHFEKLMTYTQANNNYFFGVECKSTKKTFTKQNTTLQLWAHDLQHTSHFPLQYQNIFRTEMKKMESPQLAHLEKGFTQFTWIIVQVFWLINIKALKHGQKDQWIIQDPIRSHFTQKYIGNLLCNRSQKFAKYFPRVHLDLKIDK